MEDTAEAYDVLGVARDAGLREIRSSILVLKPAALEGVLLAVGEKTLETPSLFGSDGYHHRK